MKPQDDAIVDIAPNQERYFGGAGRMLLPSVATVAAQIQKVPRHTLITTDLLRKQLARQFGVRGTCPVTTRKALQTLAQDSASSLAYWRVIKQDGGLIAQFPGGVEGHAALLRQEGFSVENGKAPKVRQFKQSLVGLD